MNLERYAYYNLNIVEVENVVNILHDKTDSYLELLKDNDEYTTAESIKGLMLEYMLEVRNQANILSEVKSSLEATNKLCSSGGADFNTINDELLKIRY